MNKFYKCWLNIGSESHKYVICICDWNDIIRLCPFGLEAIDLDLLWKCKLDKEIIVCKYSPQPDST